MIGKNEIKIYDIIKENEVIYIVKENKKEINNKLDTIFFSETFDIKKEGIVKGHGTLFEMEKIMCKIESETKKDEKKKGSGFFCKIKNLYSNIFV